MARQMNDLERFGDGAASEWNTSLATLMRMHQEMVEANFHSGYRTVESITGWQAALSSLDRELSPYIMKDEEEALDKVRVRSVTKNKALVNVYFNKLDRYERSLRKIHTKRGFGIKASDNNPGSAMEDTMY